MSKQQAKPAVQPVKQQRMQAGPCRRNPAHTDTFIESTTGRVRRCKCRVCGCKWKQSGPPAGEELGLFTGPCPANAQHTSTRVYKSDGTKNRCVCDDCGATWETTEPEYELDDVEA